MPRSFRKAGGGGTPSPIDARQAARGPWWSAGVRRSRPSAIRKRPATRRPFSIPPRPANVSRTCSGSGHLSELVADECPRPAVLRLTPNPSPRPLNGRNGATDSSGPPRDESDVRGAHAARTASLDPGSFRQPRGGPLGDAESGERRLPHAPRSAIADEGALRRHGRAFHRNARHARPHRQRIQSGSRHARSRL